MVALSAFAIKVGSGLASGIVGIVLGIAGYDKDAAVQSAGANGAILSMYNFAPLAFSVIMFVVAFSYNPDKKMPEVRAHIDNKGSGGQLK